MIAKHQQLFRHDPDNGVYGDCFRTVVACLLNVEPQGVPHFCDGPDDGLSMQRVREFLDPRGLIMIELPYDGEKLALADVLQYGAHFSQGIYWILTGRSRNGSNHIVICKANEIVHDTSIDQSGIVGPATDGFWWIGWLVKKLDCEGVAA